MKNKYPLIAYGYELHFKAYEENENRIYRKIKRFEKELNKNLIKKRR